MPIRNGRFRETATANNHRYPIVATGSKGKSGAFYRVLNSGSTSFNVVYGSETQAVAEEQSFDFYVEQGKEASIEIPTAGDVAEGIYDYLGDATSRHLEEVRSGRFRMKQGSSQEVVNLTSTGNKAIAFYRFFNTHDTNSFSIFTEDAPLKVGGKTLVVKPMMSVDVSPNAGKDLKVGHHVAPFTANAGSDRLDSNAHGLEEGDVVQLLSDDTLPAPLQSGTDYHVVEKRNNDFKLATSLAGQPIDLTDAGSGAHLWFVSKGQIEGIYDFLMGED